MLKQPLPSDGFEKPSNPAGVEVQPVGQNPFPGLRPYNTDEAHIFFGRDGQIDEILVKLSHNRFLAVTGHSGSGKSSLMNCGLIPVLYGGFVTQTDSDWHIITTRPGTTSPITNLARSVVRHLVNISRIKADEYDAQVAIIGSILRSSQEGLIAISRFIQKEAGENILFMIDQFEEVFRFRENIEKETAVDEARHYVNLIVKAVLQRDIPVYVTLIMRSDFIGKCSIFHELTNLINKSNYLVPQMTREQKRMVIEGPVAVAGGRIAPRLVKKLLNEIGTDQDQLPILQHALMRAWDYWQENREASEPIDVRHYNAIGKISQALSIHANEAYDELSPREKQIAEILFKNVTEKNQENRGMRRAARLDLITELSEANEAQVITVIDHFRRSGRSFLMPVAEVPLQSDSIIEISHESLMRIWNRLGNWVDEEFESAQMYKRLSDAAAMYQIGKTGLWRPPDLQLALNWQKKQKPTRAWAQRYDETFERAIVFLDTSRITYEAELKNQDMMQRRVLRRTRATAVILGIAAVIAILFMVFAYMKMLEADKQTMLAQVQQKEAMKQKNIAVVERNKADSLRTEAEHTSKKLVSTNNELEKALEERTIAQQEALASLNEAELQRQKAIEAGNSEREARHLADQKAHEAQENFDRANRLLMLTKAQAMAAKSVQEDDDKNLAGLLAMQAYHFHERYAGKKYDPYIYSGLYYAVTKLSSKAYNAIRIGGPPKNRINSICVTSQGSSFYASGTDGRIFKGDYLKLTSQPTEYANPFPNRVIALSADEQYLINGTDSAFVQIFELHSRSKRPVTVQGFRGATNDIRFMPGNASFIVASGDFEQKEYTLSLVTTKTGERRTLITTPVEIKTISISPDGQWLTGGTWTGEVLLVNLRDNTYSTLITEKSSRILSVKFSPDGRTIAYGTDDLSNKRGLVKLYDLRTKEIRVFSGHRAGVFDVEFSPDGELLASAGSDKRIQMWVLDHPEDLPIEMENNNGFIFDISFTRRSEYLVATTSNSEIRVWPTNLYLLAEKICPMLTRNMTQDEWNKYVGDDIGYENTCARALINDH